MDRHPWRSRIWLAGLFDVVAGGVAGVVIYLGVTGGVGFVEAALAVFQTALAVAVHLGVVHDGETKTTPVDSAQGHDGQPLMGFLQWHEIRKAIDSGDTGRVAQLVAEEIGPAEVH